MGIIHKQTAQWPTSGWHVYMLRGSSGYYFGISSSPRERFKAHIRRKTVGTLFNATYYYVDTPWKAWWIESHLHKLPEDQARQFFYGELEFRRKVFELPPMDMAAFPPALRYLYLKALEQSNAIPTSSKPRN